MITFNLKSGREISVHYFSFSYTYDGFLAGIPNIDKNKKIIASAKAPIEWGSFKVLKIRPKKKEILTTLKPVCYRALLESESLNSGNDDYYGSNLIVIWFGEDPANKTIEEIINADLKNINWEKKGMNFNL
jgi:hypothetical protein